MNENIYWDINVPLSYDKLFNFIVGQRGNGKTYGAKKWAIRRFLKEGEQFIYLRRYDTEAKSVGRTLVSDMLDEFPGENIHVDKNGKTVLADDRVAGYIMALTKSADLKSMSYPLVKTIIYDEFILEKSVHHYLRDEVKIFLNFYETIARMRDVRVFFLANAVSVNNPYFSYFHLALPWQKKILVKGDILLQLADSVEFTEAKYATRFGKLIKDTKYAEYSVQNKFVYDVNSFIGSPAGKLTYLCTFVYMDEKYGLWEEPMKAKMWLTKKIDPSCRDVYATTNDDHTPNTIFLNTRENNFLYKEMLRYHSFGLLWFDSIKTKGVFIEICGL